MVKRINLTMSDKLYSILEKKMNDNGYLTMQETVNSVLREKLIPAIKPKNAGGRPKSFELEDLYTYDRDKKETEKKKGR